MRPIFIGFCSTLLRWSDHIPLAEEMRMETSGKILCLSATGRSEMKEECNTKL